MIGTIRASLRSFHRGGATGPPSSAMRIAIAPRSFFSNRRVLDYEMAAANSCIVSPYCYNTSALRFMGGGPQNPEHKRTRSLSKKEERRKAKSERTLIDPNDVAPVPDEIRPRLPAIERYVLEDWFLQFRDGARTGRLRRDLAFRMKEGGPSPNEKLDVSVVESIAGELARRKVLQMWRTSRGIMLVPVRGENDKDGD